MQKLIIDYGNSNVKIAFYKDRIKVSTFIFESYDSPKIIYNSIKLLNFEKIYLGSSCPKKSLKLVKFLARKTHIKVTIIKNTDFIDSFDFTGLNIHEVSPDILSLAYYVQQKHSKGLGLCFGTAYFGVIVDNQKICGVAIAPSIESGLANMLKSTELIKSFPLEYTHQIGTDTPTSLSAGARNMLEGFIYNLAWLAKNNYDINKIVITGGKSCKLNFLENSKFDFIFKEDLIISGYEMLIHKLDL